MNDTVTRGNVVNLYVEDTYDNDNDYQN